MLKISKEITQFLETAGLGRTEQQLYISGLKKAGISVSELVQATTINRTTAYHALETLQAKGFAAEAKTNGRLVYAMTRPEELGFVFDRKARLLEKQRQQLGEIAALFPSPPIMPEQVSVQQFQGVEGVKQVIDQALYCKSKEWLIIAPRQNFFSQFDKSYADYYMETRRTRNIRSRTLWEKVPNKTRPSSLSLEDIALRKPRYLPESLSGRFKAVVIIFDDKAAFISSLEKESAIVLQSDELVSTLRVLFEGLWTLAEKA